MGGGEGGGVYDLVVDIERVTKNPKSGGFFFF